MLHYTICAEMSNYSPKDEQGKRSFLTRNLVQVHD